MAVGPAGAVPLQEEDVDEEWQTFTIIPDEVWCFDSRVSRERVKIDLATLKL
jgi:hypothetical protein